MSLKLVVNETYSKNKSSYLTPDSVLINFSKFGVK